MIAKIVILILAILANMTVFKWHKYDKDEAQLRIWHIVFTVLLSIGAVANFFR